MQGELELLARLLAFESGRVVPVADHLHYAIGEDALVVACVAMAGEDTSIHAMAVGKLGQAPEFYSVPDPRNRNVQDRLFRWFHDHLAAYIDACQRQGSYPQLIVSSAATVRLLDTVAERWRYTKGPGSQTIRRMGELLSWFTDRAPVAGQQTLLTATGLLNTHWATGQQRGEDEHLGTLLVWHRPPADRGAFARAIQEAERHPMGCKTNPRFDRDILSPLVASYHEAQEHNQSLRAAASAIHDALKPVVCRIYQGIQDAVALVCNSGLPEIGALTPLEEREAYEFSSFMASRAKGFRMALRDSAKAGAFNLVAREDALENWDASLVRDDALVRAGARLSGRVLLGNIVAGDVQKEGRKTIIRYKVETAQSVLKLRPQDTLTWLTCSDLHLLVESVELGQHGTTVELMVVKGQRKVGVLPVGTSLELVPRLPDWWWLAKQRKQLKERLFPAPWTHQKGSVPSFTSKPGRPADLLAAVEALR